MSGENIESSESPAKKRKIASTFASYVVDKEKYPYDYLDPEQKIAAKLAIEILKQKTNLEYKSETDIQKSEIKSQIVLVLAFDKDIKKRTHIVGNFEEVYSKKVEKPTLSIECSNFFFSINFF